MTSQTKGTLLIITGTVLWGASGVFAQHLFMDKAFSSEWLVTIRLIASGIILLCVDAFLYRQNIFTILTTKDVIPLCLFGILGLLGVQYTYLNTIIYSNVATATILQYLMPIVIVFYLLITTHRLPSAKESLSIALAMIGTFLLVTKGNFSTLAISIEALIWGFACAGFAAFYTLQPRTIIRNWRSTLIIGWGMLIGGIFMSFYQSPLIFYGIWDISAAFSLFSIIIFGTVIAFCAYLESTKYLSPTKISVFASLEPFSAIVLSFIFLHISFGFFESIGAIFIIVSVTILSK